MQGDARTECGERPLRDRALGPELLESLAEPLAQLDEVPVADAAGLGVEVRRLGDLLHQSLDLDRDLLAEIRDHLLDGPVLRAVGQHLATREDEEALQERLLLDLELALSERALELRLVERLEALDEHLRLLRERLVAVGPLVDPRQDGDRAPELLALELLRRLDAEGLEHLRLREAEEALELASHHGTRVQVRVRDLVLHEDSEPDELGDQGSEDEVLRGGQRSLRRRCRVTAVYRASHQVDRRAV